MNRHVIKRTGYSTLDLLAEIGGLIYMLFLIGYYPLMLIQGNGLIYSLLTSIFKEENNKLSGKTTEPERIKKKQSPNHDRMKSISKRIPLNEGFRVSCCDFLCRSKCMQSHYRQRMERGEERLRYELDITTFIMR